MGGLSRVHYVARTSSGTFATLVKGPIGRVCPKCNAQPGHRCTSAHKAIVTPIAKFHQERKDAVPKQRSGDER